MIGAKQFRRRYYAERDQWPQDLRDKGQAALMSVDQLEWTQPHVIAALPEYAPKTLAAMTKDITDFADAYAAWKPNSASQGPIRE